MPRRGRHPFLDASDRVPSEASRSIPRESDVSVYASPRTHPGRGPNALLQHGIGANRRPLELPAVDEELLAAAEETG